MVNSGAFIRSSTEGVNINGWQVEGSSAESSAGGTYESMPGGETMAYSLKQKMMGWKPEK